MAGVFRPRVSASSVRQPWRFSLGAGGETPHSLTTRTTQFTRGRSKNPAARAPFGVRRPA